MCIKKRDLKLNLSKLDAEKWCNKTRMFNCVHKKKLFKTNLLKTPALIILNIRGYYDRGKFVVNLGCQYGIHLVVVHQVAGEGMG